MTTNPETAKKLLWQLQATEDESAATIDLSIQNIAHKIAEQLTQSLDRFCLWLVGDLGTGKTTLTALLLHTLGLDQSIPVLSPTFTYLTEYQLPTGTVYHVDLYRLADGDEDSLETIFPTDEPWGKIIEWPERAANSPMVKPDFILEIDYVERLSTARIYRFFKVIGSKF